MELKLELTIDLSGFNLDTDDVCEMSWFFEEVLSVRNLSLHSFEIGDEVGIVRNVKVLKK